jgi:hypothetical protein
MTIGAGDEAGVYTVRDDAACFVKTAHIRLGDTLASTMADVRDY